MKPRGRDKKENIGRTFLRGRMCMGDEKRSEQKIIRTYPDVKDGQIVMIKVYESHEEPYYTIPVGWSD